MAEKKFVFLLTHSYDDPDRIAGALQLATNMKAMDIELDIFLMDKGVLLAKKGFAETLTWQKKDEFSPVGDLLNTLVSDFGVKVYICASCVKHYDLENAELIENAQVKPGTFLAEMLLERDCLNF
ncbi:MAG: hypothetical protein D6726_11265 [Nitrospirae bacterium]|nr:MAG: hypothetical protein D6726_11265 [Nitrospirota bacterium]